MVQIKNEVERKVMWQPLSKYWKIYKYSGEKMVVTSTFPICPSLQTILNTVNWDVDLLYYKYGFAHFLVPPHPINNMEEQET